jgi:hypothetical protein
MGEPGGARRSQEEPRGAAGLNISGLGGLDKAYQDHSKGGSYQDHSSGLDQA